LSFFSFLLLDIYKLLRTNSSRHDYEADQDVPGRLFGLMHANPTGDVLVIKHHRLDVWFLARNSGQNCWRHLVMILDEDRLVMIWLLMRLSNDWYVRGYSNRRDNQWLILHMIMTLVRLWTDIRWIFALGHVTIRCEKGLAYESFH